MKHEDSGRDKNVSCKSRCTVLYIHVSTEDVCLQICNRILLHIAPCRCTIKHLLLCTCTYTSESQGRITFWLDVAKLALVRDTAETLKLSPVADQWMAVDVSPVHLSISYCE